MPAQRRKYPIPTTSEEAREVCIRVLTDSLERMAAEDPEIARAKREAQKANGGLGDASGK